MENRYEGTVKWFNSEKGFGFIQYENGTKDIFVHFSQVKRDRPGRVELNEDQAVTFGIGDGLKGKQAVEVELV